MVFMLLASSISFLSSSSCFVSVQSSQLIWFLSTWNLSMTGSSAWSSLVPQLSFLLDNTYKDTCVYSRLGAVLCNHCIFHQSFCMLSFESLAKPYHALTWISKGCCWRERSACNLQPSFFFYMHSRYNMVGHRKFVWLSLGKVSIFQSCNRCRVVFQSFLSTIFL